MKHPTLLPFLVASLACATHATPPAQHASAETPPAVRGPAAGWPPLPANCVSGRPATPADLMGGCALFSAQTMGTGEVRALSITVPQYAYCDVDSGKVAGIVVQAEEAQGMEVVGFRPLGGGKPSITLLRGCRLLGQAPAEPPR